MSTIMLEQRQERYKIDNSASGTIKIIYSPLEESWLIRGFGCSQQQCQGGTMRKCQEALLEPFSLNMF